VNLFCTKFDITFFDFYTELIIDKRNLLNLYKKQVFCEFQPMTQIQLYTNLAPDHALCAYRKETIDADFQHVLHKGFTILRVAATIE
jgi:hypothetical protein